MSEKKKINVEISEELYNILDFICNQPLSPTKKEFISRAIYNELYRHQLTHDMVVKYINEDKL